MDPVDLPATDLLSVALFVAGMGALWVGFWVMIGLGTTMSHNRHAMAALGVAFGGFVLGFVGMAFYFAYLVVRLLIGAFAS